MQIRPVWAQMFHGGGGTDGKKNITKLIVAFRNFSNVPEVVTNYAKQ
jgi:hypothetical protein